jgi:hypothetical protein
MEMDDAQRDALAARRRDEPREGSALGGRKGDDGLIGATGRDVGGQAGDGWLGAEVEEADATA